MKVSTIIHAINIRLNLLVVIRTHKSLCYLKSKSRQKNGYHVVLSPFNTYFLVILTDYFVYYIFVNTNSPNRLMQRKNATYKNREHVAGKAY